MVVSIAKLNNEEKSVEDEVDTESVDDANVAVVVALVAVLRTDDEENVVKERAAAEMLVIKISLPGLKDEASS